MLSNGGTAEDMGSAAPLAPMSTGRPLLTFHSWVFISISLHELEKC